MHMPFSTLVFMKDTKGNVRKEGVCLLHTSDSF